ncbi:MAG TPA: tricarballylate utilization 4Fe-4S protein TcuB [Casimicrobiaceae bacterium]|nr:tricarballylate utilization 4Fe-4S protein TcuB [Casimicrobiaceae bacterium]
MSVADAPRLTALIEEAQRVLSICNACRYCEGYCAVFPALQRRLAFDESDVHYLANLCHNCGACLYACQYAPPHPFEVNFPQLLANVRKRSYARYAWPNALASAFERNGTVVAIVTMASIAALLLFTAWYANPVRFFSAHSDAEGSFYAVMPHGVMSTMFVVVSAFVVLALGVSFGRFWRDTGERRSELASPGTLRGAVRDSASLTYLDGAGEGCRTENASPSSMRRIFHHLTFYGFLLCFAATVIGTIYHYGFGWQAPYPFFSMPVVLGTIGGVGLLAGPAGLWWLKRRRDRDLVDRTQDGMDAGFLVLLFVTSLTGLLLLALRETRSMGVMLALHLGAVMALFLTLPYGKFVHALYRFAALLRFHRELRRPSQVSRSE